MSWKLALAFFQLVEYISHRISNSKKKKDNYLNMKRKLFSFLVVIFVPWVGDHCLLFGQGPKTNENNSI